MSLQLQAEAFFLVLIAAFLSMIIGLDRERHAHAAGLRTHMLVGVGCCLFTLLSKNAFPGADPARVASQILPGVGFIGAGAVLKERRHISGLTTAASIWSTAAVGVAVGVGAWLLALGVTLTIWVILSLIRRFEVRSIDDSDDATGADDDRRDHNDDMPDRASSASSYTGNTD